MVIPNSSVKTAPFFFFFFGGAFRSVTVGLVMGAAGGNLKVGLGDVAFAMEVLGQILRGAHRLEVQGPFTSLSRTLVDVGTTSEKQVWTRRSLMLRVTPCIFGCRIAARFTSFVCY